MPAWGASNGEGDLVVTFDTDLNPSLLPRDAPVPVGVGVAGSFRSASGDTDHLPQLRRIEVAINRQGRLFDRGLPVCRARSIQPASEVNAREVCGDAIIGQGHIVVQVRIPGQLPFLVHTRLLAFNGPRHNGRKLILAQAYARNPPGAFILTFKVSQRKGAFGTVLSTTLPPETRDWAYLTHFDMHLRRLYDYRGRKRSFVSAACQAPAGFDSAIFPFARATYSFANGQRLSLSQAATCRVAGS